MCSVFLDIRNRKYFDLFHSEEKSDWLEENERERERGD